MPTHDASPPEPRDMPERIEYAIRLDESCDAPTVTHDPALSLRTLGHGDVERLGELMSDAYRGTIDDGGETLAEAFDEVRAFLAGNRGGAPLTEACRVARADDLIVGACLVVHWKARGVPLIAYVMTRSTWKGRGLGRMLLSASLDAIRASDADEVRAVITRGNIASERLFAGLGFVAVPRA